MSAHIAKVVELVTPQNAVLLVVVDEEHTGLLLTQDGARVLASMELTNAGRELLVKALLDVPATKGGAS